MNRSPRDNSHPPRDGELAGATAGLQALVKQLRERQAKLERDNERLRDERDELRRARRRPATERPAVVREQSSLDVARPVGEHGRFVGQLERAVDVPGPVLLRRQP